jgi:hypothetical protein
MTDYYSMLALRDTDKGPTETLCNVKNHRGPGGPPALPSCNFGETNRTRLTRQNRASEHCAYRMQSAMRRSYRMFKLINILFHLVRKMIACNDMYIFKSDFICFRRSRAKLATTTFES